MVKARRGRTAKRSQRRNTRLAHRKSRKQRRNRAQRGGGRANYSLYAFLPDDVAGAVAATTDQLQSKYGDYLKWKTNHAGDPPHITIAYGPSIDYSEEEVLEKGRVDEVYPGIMKFEARGLPDIAFSTINTFDRADKYVVKIQWDSDMLLEMYEHISATIPEVRDTYTSYAAMDGLNLNSYYYKMSHTTLCVLDRAKVDAEAGLLEKILADAEAAYKGRASFTAKNISLISAKSDTPVRLW